LETTATEEGLERGGEWKDSGRRCSNRSDAGNELRVEGRSRLEVVNRSEHTFVS
jgi:hypothetical protein